MIAGLLLAVGCALAGSVAVLLKQRGEVAAPAVRARHPLRSAINLFGLQVVDGGLAGGAQRGCCMSARCR